MIFDTHCHPYLSKEIAPTELIEKIRKTSTPRFLLSIGVDVASSSLSIELANKHDFIFASVGISPCDTTQYQNTIEESFETLEGLIKQKKVKAIGECGLDYYWLPPKIESTFSVEELKKMQVLFFRRQIVLAKKYNLPLIIHNRDARNDVFTLLQEENCTNFIMHCYSEDMKFAKKLLDFSPDCLISFSGIVTFKNATDIVDTVKNIPLKNILIETDSPYLSPAPYRGKENYPWNTRYILDKIIELREETAETVEEKIFENSLRVFSINGNK